MREKPRRRLAVVPALPGATFISWVAGRRVTVAGWITAAAVLVLTGGVLASAAMARALPGPAPPAAAASASGGFARAGSLAYGRPERAVRLAGVRLAVEVAAGEPGVAAAAARAGPTGSDDESAPGTRPDLSSLARPPDDAGLDSERVPPAGAGVPAPGSGYAWPLYPTPTVASPFRAPEHAYGPGHRGADLLASVGQAVLAARAGVVVFAGAVGGRGVVSVDHDDGLRTTYEPLQPMVRAGTAVAAGAVLGVLLPGHRTCTPACLHWGVRRNRLEYLDPLVLLRPTRVRLLPTLDG
jgi:murein DD-endopeptidase MepM/ murein hydrolase activator NlpD